MHRPLALLALLLLTFGPGLAAAQPAPRRGLAEALDPERDQTAPDPFAGTRLAGLPAAIAVVESATKVAPGTTGEHVAAVQEALRDMAFLLPGTTPGRLDELTLRALRNFQAHASTAFPTVRVNGDLDAATLRALAALAPAAGQRGQRGHTPSNVYDGRPVRVVVVKSEHRTFVFDDAGRVTHVFANATGAPATRTRSALKTVDAKLGAAECAALGRRLWGNATVFGERLVGLSGGGQELHGTNAPSKLGLDVSKGCVRHHNPDMLVLFDLVRVGDRVAIVDRVDDPHLGAPAPIAAE